MKEFSKDTPLALTSVIARNEGIVSAEIDQEVAMLDIERGVCFGMNKIASRVWALVQRPARVSDICATLVNEYEVSPSDCERQILDLLEELLAEGLITTQK
jgi:hypothetical protein